MSTVPVVITLNDYQRAAAETADSPEQGISILYPTIKLAGEAGEVAEKVGKAWRNCNQRNIEDYPPELKIGIAKELGDVLWYVAYIAGSLGYSLEEIAAMNIEKLFDRRERGVVKGEGDNR